MKLFTKRNSLIYTLLTGGLLLLLSGCSTSRTAFSSADRKIIQSGDANTLLYIYNVNTPKDTAILRAKSVDLSTKHLSSGTYRLLKARMLKTVQDSIVDGVGLAAPQIGINKRIVAVQRYDKKGFPFEVYANIKIEKFYGAVKNGREGCLSVPDRNEAVPRRDSIIISYLHPATLKPIHDTVGGFTAIIFQHEIDHLEGKLYIDYGITEKSKID